ncbi:MAG: hypothetical protein HYR85_25875 [Planctomycetes bacterium]|nr:hypothetical protein [Planctomycetota bacterium]MBI3845318.1 hypothetical protein [Planctomycetota bacterium]
MRDRWIALSLLAVLVLAFASMPRRDDVFARLESPPPPCPCSKDSAYRKLDFWLGKWSVATPDGTKDGDNVIEKVLGGCAIIENWKDVDGSEGKSLFYYQPVRKLWRQVWVTDQGSMKEKTLVEEFPDGGVRFQGEIPLPDGRKILDRTTLTPRPDGTVRQLIEQSADAGKTWRVAFDAIYTRQK